MFASPKSKSGHVEAIEAYYARITLAGGAKFWFHALRNCFITVAERELLLPRSLTKRLVNHARPSDVTEGYAADWTVEQLRDRKRSGYIRSAAGSIVDLRSARSCDSSGG